MRSYSICSVKSNNFAYFLVYGGTNFICKQKGYYVCTTEQKGQIYRSKHIVTKSVVLVGMYDTNQLGIVRCGLVTLQESKSPVMYVFTP